MSHSVWSAPAKLNLMLHIVGRRADGYHELQSVFQLLDLCDRVEITVRTDGGISRPRGAAGVADVVEEGRPAGGAPTSAARPHP